jgi:uncharacterized protein
MLALEAMIGFLIGLSLGLLGGGGSILTVPALVYLVGQTPQAAIATSLAIVGANSMVGAAFHNRRGTLNWQVALLFGASGMVFAFLAAGFSRIVPPALLMVLFGVLMLVVGWLMLKPRGERLPLAVGETHSPVRVLLAGAGVGVLTGLLGVGGGFLIVPALVMLVGLPISQAVGTSLVIIAANSLAGFIGHFEFSRFDARLVLVFVIAGAVGAYTGVRLANVLPANRLRQAFAIFVMALAVLLLIDNLPRLLAFG